MQNAHVLSQRCRCGWASTGIGIALGAPDGEPEASGLDSSGRRTPSGVSKPDMFNAERIPEVLTSPVLVSSLAPHTAPMALLVVPLPREPYDFAVCVPRARDL